MGEKRLRKKRESARSEWREGSEKRRGRSKELLEFLIVKIM